MLMHSEILALTLQHARPRRCRSPACFSIPSHFLFLLNYPRPESQAPPEGFHGRRLKSGSPRAFTLSPTCLSTSSSSRGPPPRSRQPRSSRTQLSELPRDFLGGNFRARQVSAFVWETGDTNFTVSFTANLAIVRDRGRNLGHRRIAGPSNGT